MAPKTKAQFEEIRLRTTRTIKKAALELFARNGYHSTSISQIAKAAGVSKGLMYNYFESKEALLHEIILEVVEQGEDMIEEVFATIEDGYEILKTIVEGSFAWISADLHHWKLLTSLAFQTDVLKSLEPILLGKQEKAMQQLARVFEKLNKKQPVEEALLFAGLLDGVILHYMQMEEKYPLEKMKKFILERYKLDAGC